MNVNLQFLSLEKLHSEKKDKDYYKLNCLLDNKTCDVFLTKEVYEKLSIRDLKYLQTYSGCFKVYNRYGSLAIDLEDLKELK